MDEAVERALKIQKILSHANCMHARTHAYLGVVEARDGDGQRRSVLDPRLGHLDLIVSTLDQSLRTTEPRLPDVFATGCFCVAKRGFREASTVEAGVTVDAKNPTII